MNQSIIFTDNEEWDPIRNAVICSALVNGFQVHCCIQGKVINARFGFAERPEQFIELFRQYRWDLEDEFEQMILNEEFDNDGWVVI
ncbi:DUF1488 domain-containing protein [Limnobaculum zhutongyuii]|uniref:DUF1488 domain-containing protein n=1 Tax=Limnobaculum zhutongyuii TaxID=2498113 RepID=A0A411WPU1_9GAMM|nr:DUF1488 domain-containing protein [Limnobaculum zhutongyuii]QBH98176.1 DUF1488 domain-containing protein [Limnobaculum zhutongyuii]TQS86272.1 DUF1488 domain-containing protein [Limnobaculum zhutongyuii]